MEISVEKLQRKDLKEAILVYDQNHHLKTNMDNLFSIYDKIDDNPLYHNIVAKVDGKIVGFATVMIHYDIVEELKPFLTVWNFGVKEEYRRKKIGTEMFRYIDFFAKENHCAFIALFAEKDNIIAQKFYEGLHYDEAVGYVKFIGKKCGNDGI